MSTPYTMAALMAAQNAPFRNFQKIAEMATYLMMSGLERSSHLKVCWSYTWAQEMMGNWEAALGYYQLLETQEESHRAAYMVICQASVLHRMGREATARELLSSLVGSLETRVADPGKRAWVQGKIERLIAKMDSPASEPTDN